MRMIICWYGRQMNTFSEQFKTSCNSDPESVSQSLAIIQRQIYFGMNDENKRSLYIYNINFKIGCGCGYCRRWATSRLTQYCICICSIRFGLGIDVISAAAALCPAWRTIKKKTEAINRKRRRMMRGGGEQLHSTPVAAIVVLSRWLLPHFLSSFHSLFFFGSQWSL